MNYKEEMYLKHYGVLGMKWGQRRARRAANGARLSSAISKGADKHSKLMLKKAERLSSEGKNKKAQKAINGAKLSSAISKGADIHSKAMQKKADRITKELAAKKKQSVKDFTDEELKKKVSRLQLEKQYKDLSKSNIDRGKDFAKKIATTSVSAAVSGIAVVKIRKALGAG